MTNTHYVDDDVGVAPANDDLRAWPLEALATAPVAPTDVWFDGARATARQTRVKHRAAREPHGEPEDHAVGPRAAFTR